MTEECRKCIQHFFERNRDFSLSYPDSNVRPEVCDNFFQIIRRGSRWREIDFHFEVLWWEEPVRKVFIVAHFEKNDSKSFDDAFEFFRGAGAAFGKRPENDYYNIFMEGTAEGMNIDVDFSSEEATVDYLGMIVSILSEENFARLAKLADEFEEKIK